MFHNRIKIYKAGNPTPGQYVLYWMQQSQRVTYNHALEYAIQTANKHKLPLLVVFVFDIGFPEANQRHFAFMIQGLKEVEKGLAKRGITLLFRQGNMVSEILKIAQQAACLISDFGYLKIQRQWRERIADLVKIPFVCLESDIVVPVEKASDKQEYMARTIRPKIEKQLDDYLIPFETYKYQGKRLDNQSSFDPDTLLPLLNNSPSIVSEISGGYSIAISRLDKFIQQKLNNYHLPNKDLVNSNYSELSPYLHFGQISVLEIVEKVKSAHANLESQIAFLEQLIIRRELAINFCYYNQNYDNYDYINPQWAADSLDFHSMDARDYIYDLQELEEGQTHDPAWNAAQIQMVKTGYMHNYLRMYWGKKIIEWSLSPRQAYYNMLYLNNKYELDGRDPNAFTGIAWCFGNHDTAWKERDIFGKVRYMNYQGLKRKFAIKAYEDKWNK
jgi:deoxyribodipyrimidine photo-lyase